MSSYFVDLVALPTVINGPGDFVTRCGEVVKITQSSHRHDFGCAGAYSNNVAERWHKSGRLFALRETANDVVSKHEPRISVGIPCSEGALRGA